MKCCNHHWESIRVRVHEIGLGHLLHDETFDQSMCRIERELKAEDTSPLDPRETMYQAFADRCILHYGLIVLMERQNGEQDGMPPNDWHVCPLCYVKASWDQHNTADGTCGSTECGIRISPGDQPWEEQWLEMTGRALLIVMKASGKITIN